MSSLYDKLVCIHFDACQAWSPFIHGSDVASAERELGGRNSSGLLDSSVSWNYLISFRISVTHHRKFFNVSLGSSALVDESSLIALLIFSSFLANFRVSLD